METLKSFNPATGELVGELSVTPAGMIREIVNTARAAQPAWAARSLEERRGLLLPAAAKIEKRMDELAALITREMGKPIREARAEVKAVSSRIEGRTQEMLEALQPDVLEDSEARSVVYHDAFGVAGVIAPWNFPMSMPNSMILPALMAGNTVVFKPSEEAPLCGQAYADILNESLPPDVLIVIHGADEQGKALVTSGADLIAFTGSRAVGKLVLRAASENLTRVVLELGGKDPMIVLDTADLDAAAKFAVGNGMRNAGQMCVATERIYVDKKIADEFSARLCELVKGLTVGDGAQPDTRVGPLVNSHQKNRVLEMLEDAESKGAKVLVGGSGHHDNYVMPTVLTNINNDMTLAREEIFGPVVTVTPVDSDDDAIRKSNATPYGLGAVVFGALDDRTEGVARRLASGMVGINRGVMGAHGTPWVGARESGYGYHGGKDGHRQFAQARVVSRKR